MARSGFRYNPAVFSDPQVIPQLEPPRRRGRPTLYSPELIEEFCGLIVDGMTVDRACKEPGMPSKRTIQYWLKEYPEFRREFEEAVLFRNQIWMDRSVDIADDTPDEANWTKVNARINARWKQLSGARLKAVAQPADKANKPKIVEHDPVRAQLYQWELEYQKRQRARANEHSDGRDK
jgi:hypothetical protein